MLCPGSNRLYSPWLLYLQHHRSCDLDCQCAYALLRFSFDSAAVFCSCSSLMTIRHNLHSSSHQNRSSESSLTRHSRPRLHLRATGALRFDWTNQSFSSEHWRVSWRECVDRSMENAIELSRTLGPGYDTRRVASRETCVSGREGTSDLYEYTERKDRQKKRCQEITATVIEYWLVLVQLFLFTLPYHSKILEVGCEVREVSIFLY